MEISYCVTITVQAPHPPTVHPIFVPRRHTENTQRNDGNTIIWKSIIYLTGITDIISFVQLIIINRVNDQRDKNVALQLDTRQHIVCIDTCLLYTSDAADE